MAQQFLLFIICWTHIATHSSSVLVPHVYSWFNIWLNVTMWIYQSFRPFDESVPRRKHLTVMHTSTQLGSIRGGQTWTKTTETTEQLRRIIPRLTWVWTTTPGLFSVFYFIFLSRQATHENWLHYWVTAEGVLYGVIFLLQSSHYTGIIACFACNHSRNNTFYTSSTKPLLLGFF